MKTLVIHPQDSSTDFLKQIYSDLDCQIISDPKTSRKVLIQSIKDNDRIIMLGHGTEKGLVDMESERFIIDSNYVYLLREKQCVCIWCNADVFVNKYKLKGLYSGMIVSEYVEAVMWGLYLISDADIYESNTLFSTAVKSAIHLDEPQMIVEIKNNYKTTDEVDDENRIILFNRENIFYNL